MGYISCKKNPHLLPLDVLLNPLQIFVNTMWASALHRGLGTVLHRPFVIPIVIPNSWCHFLDPQWVLEFLITQVDMLAMLQLVLQLPRRKSIVLCAVAIVKKHVFTKNQNLEIIWIIIPIHMDIWIKWALLDAFLFVCGMAIEYFRFICLKGSC